VTVVIEPRHQDDAVNAHAPFFLKHRFRLLPEDAWCCAFQALCFALAELFALWKYNAKEANANTQTSGNPENCLPAVRRSTNAKISTSGADVARLYVRGVNHDQASKRPTQMNNPVVEFQTSSHVHPQGNSLAPLQSHCHTRHP
jgi:hypothetical protein